MPSVDQQRVGRDYWVSLDDFADSPEFRDMVAREFPSQLETIITPASRRHFLKLMGASLALGGVGLTGCRRWPEEKIAPFAHRPEDRTPGVPQYYATAMELGGVAEGLVITSSDGRPVKIEGNTLHPNNLGASGSYAQASVLELYDPDRSRTVVNRQSGRAAAASWSDFLQFARPHFDRLKSQRGRRFAVLAETSSSQTTADMRNRLSEAFPASAWYEYEPISRDNARAGSTMAFGRPMRSQFALAKASIIVSLDSDLLFSHPAWIRNAREFASTRHAEADSMSRLYVVESAASVTGAASDHRYATRSGNVPAIAAALARTLRDHGVNIPGGSSVTGADLPQDLQAFIGAAASDLADAAANGRFSLISVGDRQPAEVHALAHAMNEALGNVGQTVAYTAAPDPDRANHIASLQSLVQQISDGRINTLLILGGNPAYNAPGDVDFAGALAALNADKNSVVIHLSNYDDETSRLSAWHVPRAHFLESWSDARGWDGTVSVVQPLIEAIYGGKTPAEMLALALDDEVTEAYDLVRRTFQGLLDEDDFEKAFRRVLHDGVQQDSASPIESVTVSAGGWTRGLSTMAEQFGTGTTIDEVVLVQDPSLYDGRFATNGWLQELPDPITKITWDNAALMSPATAEAIGVGPDDMVTVRTAAGSIKMAAHVTPGHADGTVAVQLGYGRTAAAHIGSDVGFNSYAIRAASGPDIAAGASVTKADGRHQLALTQDHHVMQTSITEVGKQERVPDILREARFDRFKQEEHPADAFFDPGQHTEHPRNLSLWDDYKYPNSRHKWGMAIDLSSCIGCSACMIACQAENNVPIVGKDQVMRGREMHWIRIDRYFKFKVSERDKYGKAEAWDSNQVTSVSMQPVTCQHCETAPCEQVCPVAATVHDDEGLNLMVYNRCVGTRYCSNNCPYKVRRFNYYDWYDRDPREEGLSAPALVMPDQQHLRSFKGRGEVRKMLFNPEVTVRPRGVMEKCSFCLQRISAAKVKAKNDWVDLPPAERSAEPEIPDGVITPACAQACPTRAIVFGDLKDANSRVKGMHDNHDRKYDLLGYLNTKPRNKYLGRVRNPNPSYDPPPEPVPHADTDEDTRVDE